MNQSLKEQRRRERLREYEAALAAAASALGVLAMFVRARESRAHGESLEEVFAASAPDGVEPFPAAIWVALRQDDIDAALDLLLTLSSTDFLLAEHEQVDGDYRLVTVEESRRLPELDRLLTQLSKALRVPVDVQAVVAGWGPEDPRTVSEIEGLLDDRFGSPLADTSPPRGADAPPTFPAGERPAAATTGLAMTAEEFAALLNLSPDQARVLATLVRQASITIDAGR